jgi:4-amino-4-deoxy-L-arabinose transferase-like glycosyltransferase
LNRTARLASSSSRARRAGAPRRIRPGVYLFFFAAFALVVFASHLPLLRLPYYWDELGQYVPAALDLCQHGQWIPHTTVPNVHPPGLMAYLAVAWHIFGYSIPVTRLAMLLLASFAALATFLLAIELCRKTPGAPALFAVLFLLVSPLFYTQAMLAELDMPAMLLTVVVLLLFLQDRFALAALAAVVLVLVKETGLVVPALLCCWLLAERRWRAVTWFLLPALALGGWLAVLWLATGDPLGSSSFASYNLYFPLHPLRLSLALLRRGYYLFFENFHWIGWIAIAIAWRRTQIFRSRAWRIAATVAVVQVLMVTVFGGAVLERYLMPVLPIICIAMAAAFSAAPVRWMPLGQAALVAGLLFSMFWNPPYPYPFENNLAMVDFVRLQQVAAEFVERNYPDRTIATAWPLTGALWRPEFGYVHHRMSLARMSGFGVSSVSKIDPRVPGVFVLYSREWETRWDPRHQRWASALARRFYGYEPQVSPEFIERRFGMTRAARWQRRGQWIMVFARD